MNTENFKKLMSKLNSMYDDIIEDEIKTYIDKYMNDNEVVDAIFSYICRHKAGLYDKKSNIQKDVDKQLENDKVIIKNDSEFNDFIDNTLGKFNLFENDFETNKMKISDGIVSIEEMWMEVSKEKLSNVADFKEFIKGNSNIDVGTFNITIV